MLALTLAGGTAATTGGDGANGGGTSSLDAQELRVELDGSAAGTGGNAGALQLCLLLTVLSLVPAILAMVTGFVCIAIVLSFARNAIGVPHLPPNQILLGLSLFLTMFVMAPPWEHINDEALQP